MHNIWESSEMGTLYLWPDQVALSLFVLWLASTVFLWAAREPMLNLLKGLGKFLDDGCQELAAACRTAAQELRKRVRATLLAAGKLDAQSKLDREFQRIDASLTNKLGQYPKLHLRLDDVIVKLDADYHQCGDVPPEIPGWTSAIEAISQIPSPGDPNVQKVLESIRKSSHDAEKRALQAYREDTARRHKMLGAMAPRWKEAKELLTRVRDSLTAVLDRTQWIQQYAEDYESVRKEHEVAARALTYSATKLFVVSLIVLGIAMGGAFVNFQLIALPMSELVPAGARIGGMSVSMISALVIVLMETALGIFIMDMLGITDLLPKLRTLAPSRRRLILTLALFGLFFLAGVESSLAVLREQIVAADSALKLSLAGETSLPVTQASASRIPVIGQAVLGFVLPWVLAMVAIPLEMLLDSSRHVLALAVVWGLHALGQLSRLLAWAAVALTSMLVNVYDVYISIPLRIERAVRSQRPRSGLGGLRPPGEQHSEVTTS
jgi:hypothetical protein